VARSTGIILAAGGITLANEAVFAPLAGHGAITHSFNWRVIPATAFAAMALAGLEHLSEQFAVGVAWIALVTVLFSRLGKAPAPLENLANVLGYGPKKGG
jgi:hypothetical protein